MPFTLIASVVRVPWHSSHGGYDRLLDYLPEAHRIVPPASRWSRAAADTAHRLAGPRCPLPFYPPDHFATDLRVLASRRPAHVLYGEEQFWFSRHRTAPTAVTYHQPAAHLATLLPPATWRDLVPRANQIIVLESGQHAFFADRTDPKRVHLIPHGIDTTAFTPANAATEGQRPLVLTVGWWLRDWDLLHDVHRCLHERHGTHVDLAVVTRRGTQRPWHPAARVLHDLTEPALTALYQRAAAVLLPLTDATANNALLEAMACGAPVVATDIGGIRHYADDGQGTLLVPPGDVLSAADSVETLLTEWGTSTHTARRHAARRRAEDFAWPRVAAQVRAVYRLLEEER